MRHLLPCLVLIISFSLQGCSQKNKSKNVPATNYDSIIPAKPTGWVSDFEYIFTPEQANYIDSIIGQHEKETTNEIAIVSLKLDSDLIATSEDFDKFSLALFRRWGVGKKDKNNGAGILISRNLKKVRIEVGYGLEAKLTNEEAQIIIDTMMLPEFRKGNYYAGVLNGLSAIFKEIK